MPPRPGPRRDEILEACADREIDVLFLIGVDPLRDCPDAALALRALENVDHEWCSRSSSARSSRSRTRSCRRRRSSRRRGTSPTWEGRGQRIKPVAARRRDLPSGLGDLRGLALACGGDLGFETLEELHEEMGALLAPREIVRARHTPPRAGRRLRTRASSSSPTRCWSTRARCPSDRPSSRRRLGRAPFAEIHPARRGDRRHRRRHARVLDRRRQRDPSRARHRARRGGRDLRPLQPAGLRRQHAASRATSRDRRPAAGDAEDDAAAARSPRGGPPDGLARLAAAGRCGSSSCSSGSCSRCCSTSGSSAR